MTINPDVAAAIPENVDKTQTANITQDEKITQPSPDNPSTQEDPNWRAFREARKKDRADREAAEKKAMDKEAEVTALKAAMEAAFAKSPIPSPSQVSYDQPREETEDERIDKKVQAALAQREAIYEQQRRKQEHEEFPQMLRKNFVDFDQTISQENLDYLDYHYPEVSVPLQRLQDGYDKWADIYRAVKKFVSNSTGAKKDAQKADANFMKPKSISSTGITQPGEATTNARLTEEKRAQNWERMQKILKGVS